MNREMVTVLNVSHFGQSGFLDGPDGTKWPCLRLGPHTCILLLHKEKRFLRRAEIYVGLLREYKEVLNSMRIKILSDFNRGRPSNAETAREIIAAKTGLTHEDILWLARLDQMVIPGWPPNVVFDNTLIWFAWTGQRNGKNVVWLNTKELWTLLKRLNTQFIDVPTDHLLRWVEALVHHKETLPEEP